MDDIEPFVRVCELLDLEDTVSGLSHSSIDHI